jgi:hypothetical protein
MGLVLPLYSLSHPSSPFHCVYLSLSPVFLSYSPPLL